MIRRPPRSTLLPDTTLFRSPQVLAEMAVVTQWVNCAAVENPNSSQTCRQRRQSTAVFRINSGGEALGGAPWAQGVNCREIENPNRPQTCPEPRKSTAVFWINSGGDALGGAPWAQGAPPR